SRPPDRLIILAKWFFIMAFSACPCSLESVFGDEIHHWSRIGRCERIMPFPFLDDDGHRSAHCLESWFNGTRVVIEPGVETSADTQEWHTGFGQWGQIIE